MKRFVPAFLCLFFVFSGNVWAADPSLIDLVESTTGYSSAVKVLLVLTLFSFLPALVLTMTSFTRLVIVFSLLRHAIKHPPGMVRWRNRLPALAT